MACPLTLFVKKDTSISSAIDNRNKLKGTKKDHTSVGTVFIGSLNRLYIEKLYLYLASNRYLVKAIKPF